MPQYRFVNGSRLPQEKAQAVGEHIEDLRAAAGGKLAAADVVADAKLPHSPLHSLFPWNDTEAAQLHRLNVARHLLRSIEVIWEDLGHEKMVAAPMFVNIASPAEDGATSEHASYMSLKNALKDPVLRKQVLERALAEADAWATRYERFKELSGIVKAIKAAKAKKIKKKKQ